jgi:hypothetical protein
VSDTGRMQKIKNLLVIVGARPKERIPLWVPIQYTGTGWHHPVLVTGAGGSVYTIPALDCLDSTFDVATMA